MTGQWIPKLICCFFSYLTIFPLACVPRNVFLGFFSIFSASQTTFAFAQSTNTPAAWAHFNATTSTFLGHMTDIGSVLSFSIGKNLFASTPSSVYETIRTDDIEHIFLPVGTTTADKATSALELDLSDTAREEARFSLLQTLLIVVLLALGAVWWTHESKSLARKLEEPLERLTSDIKNISEAKLHMPLTSKPSTVYEIATIQVTFFLFGGPSSWFWVPGMFVEVKKRHDRARPAAARATGAGDDGTRRKISVGAHVSSCCCAAHRVGRRAAGSDR